MKPLVVLIIAFIISFLALRIFSGTYGYVLAIRIAMAVMLVFTSIGHFAFTKGMTMMVPDFMPFKKAFVYGTGVFEIFAAIGLLITQTRVSTGWLLVIFFLIMLPANINAAYKHVDYQKGTLDGSGPRYLWFRVPLQILFVALGYICTIG